MTSIFVKYKPAGVSSDGRTLLQSTDGVLYACHKIHTEGYPAEEVQKEVEILAEYDNRNIIKVHECVVLEGNTLFILQCYSQRTLGDSIDDPCLDSQEIIKNIALGVSYLHKKRRLLLSGLQLKFIYLGCEGPLLRNVSKPEHEGLMESASYKSMPPEFRDGQYGYESDIWLLGVLFLQITLKEKIQESTSQEFGDQLLAALAKVTNSDIRSLIERMLDNQCESRPTIQQTLHTLNILVDPQPILACSTVDKLIRHTQDFWVHKLSNRKLTKILEEHFPLIEQQAVKENPTAMFLMGRRYQTSDRKEEAFKAKDWLHKAAESGEARAYTNLFNFYTGIGIVKLEYLEKGVELNDYRSIWTLARQVGYGFDGVDINRDRALELMKSLPDSYPDAKYDIVSLTARIEGANVNYPSSLSHLLKRGAEQGDRKAVQALSDCMEDLGRYKEAAKLGLITAKREESCIGPEYQVSARNGLYYSRLGDQLSRRRWLTRAKEQGSSTAKNNLIKFELF